METEQRKVTFRMYPTPKQEEALERLFELHRHLYNALLEQRIAAWKRQGKSLSFALQCREITELRAADPEYRTANAQSLQVTARRIALAFKHFFKRVKKRKGAAGFPRFKSSSAFSGFGYKTFGDGWSLKHAVSGKQASRSGRLRISGAGWIRIRGKGRNPGEPVTCEVLCRRGCWYASITFDCSPVRQSGNEIMGCDLGVETFATIAGEGNKVAEIANPRLYRKYKEKLVATQRLFSAKNKGSHSWKKAKARLSVISGMLANSRRDILHKESAKLISNCHILVTEKLALKGMTGSARGTIQAPGKNVSQKAALNRSILDVAPGLYLGMIRAKAKEAAVVLLELTTRGLKPSQRCWKCWKLVPKTLADRLHVCVCGESLARDHNTALLFRKIGIHYSRGPAHGVAAAIAAAAAETPSVAA